MSAGQEEAQRLLKGLDSETRSRWPTAKAEDFGLSSPPEDPGLYLVIVPQDSPATVTRYSSLLQVQEAIQEEEGRNQGSQIIVFYGHQYFLAKGKYPHLVLPGGACHPLYSETCDLEIAYDGCLWPEADISDLEEASKNYSNSVVLGGGGVTDAWSDYDDSENDEDSE